MSGSPTLFEARSTPLQSLGGTGFRMVAGILVWAYTLLLPSFEDTGFVAASLLAEGPWGMAMLRPQALRLRRPRL